MDNASADTATDSLDQAIDEYIGFQRTRAKAEQIAPQRFHVYQAQIDCSGLGCRSWATQACRQSRIALGRLLSAPARQIKTGRDWQGPFGTYAKGIMDAVKQLARRCFQRHLIELPRNLDRKVLLAYQDSKDQAPPASYRSGQSIAENEGRETSALLPPNAELRSVSERHCRTSARPIQERADYPEAHKNWRNMRAFPP